MTSPENNAPPEPASLDTPEGLSDASLGVLSRIVTLKKVAVMDGEVAELAEIDAGTLDPLLDELSDAGLIVRWTISPQYPTRLGQHGPVITFSPATAHALRLKLDRHSTHWVPVDGKERRVRMIRKYLDGGVQVINEADLKVDPPGMLARQADPNAAEAGDVAEESEEKIRETEREGGYLRPTHVVGCGVAWPAAGQRRGPQAPRPGDVPEGHRPLGEDAPGPCGGCGGHVGPDTICLACDLYSSDHMLPKRERMMAGKTNHGKTERANQS